LDIWLLVNEILHRNTDLLFTNEAKAADRNGSNKYSNMHKK